MLAKDPNDRQPTMRDVIVELQACLKPSEGGPSSPDSLPGSAPPAALADDDSHPQAAELPSRGAGK
jgi:hypothetical protein